MKQVVILAGGKGTRLRERLGDLPKPLIDICGKPLLERQIDLAKRHGYTHVLLLVNYASQHILDFCASRNNWGLSIDCIDDGEPRGTAGATLAVFPRLDKEFLLMYGDTMLEVDLTRFHNFHCSRPDAAATLLLHPNDHPHDSDLVEMGEDGRITGFHPYPHQVGRYYPNLVNAALYYIRREALEPWRSSPETLDFGKDVFPSMLERGVLLLGYNSPEYIKDCGTPKRLDKVCADFLSGRLKRASLDVPQKAVFLDRDGTINREVGHLSHHDQLEFLPGVEEAIKNLNNSVYRTIVVTNQPVLARGDCSSAGLKAIHDKMETLLGYRGAYLDRIYYCPHHPDRGFPEEVPGLKVDCDCRKPGTGMLERARREVNVDLTQSWLVGDSSVDMMTARRAGVRSVLVETGCAGLDGRYRVTSDFTVPDLPSAVNFILNDHPRLISLCAMQGRGIGEGDFVFIGGLSRSGKSNLATCLKESLQAQGKGAVVIATDRWLRNEDERIPGVLGRYATDEMRVLLGSLMQRTSAVPLELPAYDKMNRQRVPGELVVVGPKEVVIVEGTVALTLLDGVRGAVTHSWFVEIDEDVRRQRVLNEYRLRGREVRDAEAIYAKRQQDETPVILATAGAATQRFRVELGASPRQFDPSQESSA